MVGKLYVLMGQPGSGKSTWVKNHAMTEDGVVVSRDAVRFSMVSEDEPYFSKEKQVFKTFVNEINFYLMNGRTVFADATHLTQASRNKLLRNIRWKPAETSVIWLQTSLNTAINRNAERKGTRSYVPASDIRRMYASIDPPRFEEGFDKIYIVKEDGSITIHE